MDSIFSDALARAGQVFDEGIATAFGEAIEARVADLATKAALAPLATHAELETAVGLLSSKAALAAAIAPLVTKAELDAGVARAVTQATAGRPNRSEMNAAIAAAIAALRTELTGT